MTSILRVDPARLLVAAAAQADVSAYVSSIGAGQSMADAVQAMSGLASGSACQFAGAALDGVTQKVSAELSAHSDRLSAAADRYRRADEELGLRLRRLAE